MQVMEVPMKVAVHLPLRPSFNDMAKRGELAQAVAEALAQIARDHGAIVTVGEVASRSYLGRAEPGGPPAVVVPDPRRYKDTDANGRLLPGGTGGITEWVKIEDLQRMEADMETEIDMDAQPTEEAFDIF